MTCQIHKQRLDSVSGKGIGHINEDTPH